MNESEQEMAEWLANPMEFGEAPVEVSEIHQEETPWPLYDEQVKLSFHRYKMKDGFSSIGMTGPITWSFFGDSLEGFSMDELKRLYAGWYISFVAINSDNYSKGENKRKRQAAEAQLKQNIDGFEEIVAFLSFGELVFYAYKCRREGKEWVVATDGEDKLEYEEDSKYLRLPPLFYFLGWMFFEGKL